MRKDTFSYRVLMLFLSNLALYLIASAYRVSLSRLAGSSALGLNSLVNQVYGALYALCIPGLGIAVTSLSASLPEGELGGLLKSALFVLALLWCAACALVLPFGRAICRGLFGDGGLFPVLIPMLSCVLLTGAENILKALHMGTKRVMTCAASELIEQSARVVLAILLLKSASHDADSKKVFLIMLAMLSSEFVSVTALSVSFLTRFKTRGGGGAKYVRPTFTVAFPVSVNAVSATLFSSVGALLLPGRLMSYGMTHGAALSAVGELTTALIPLTMLPMTYAGAVSRMMTPEVSRMNSEGVSPCGLIKKQLLRAALVCGAACALLCALSKSVTALLFGPTEYGFLYPLLFVSAFAAFIHGVAVSALNGLFMQKTVLVIGVSSEAFRLALMLLLVPALGLWGYAMSLAMGGILSAAAALACVLPKSKKGMEFSRRIC